MDMIYSIECVSSSDGMEDDDALSSNLPRPFLKASAAAIVAASIGVVPGGGGGASGAGAAGGIAGPIPPATSVHELHECPVCTNSMYPPIHQLSASCPGVVSVSWFLGCLLEPRCRSTTSSSPISRLKQKTEKQAVVVAPSASPSVLDLWMAQYAWPYEDEC